MEKSNKWVDNRISEICGYEPAGVVDEVEKRKLSTNNERKSTDLWMKTRRQYKQMTDSSTFPYHKQRGRADYCVKSLKSVSLSNNIGTHRRATSSYIRSGEKTGRA